METTDTAKFKPALQPRQLLTLHLAPMARANAAQGESVLNYLLKNHRSTRELQCFYTHYQRSNHPQGLKMAHDPDLFFKAQKLLAVEKDARWLQAEPAGQWQSQWSVVRNALASLVPLIPHLFTPYQAIHEHVEYLRVLEEAKKQFDVLTQTVRSLTGKFSKTWGKVTATTIKLGRKFALLKDYENKATPITAYSSQ